MEHRSTINDHFNKPIFKLPCIYNKYLLRYKYGYGPCKKKLQERPMSKSGLGGTKNCEYNKKLNSYNLFNEKPKIGTTMISYKIINENNRLFEWSNFWLPKIILTPQMTREIENQFVEEKKEIVTFRNIVVRNQQLRSFLKWKRLVDDAEFANIHVCRMLDGKWAVITRDVVILLWDKSSYWHFENVEIVFSLPLKHIVALSVDPCLSVIYFIMGPECFSKWDITPGEIIKTEEFISYLIVAILRVRNASERNEIGMVSKSKDIHYSPIYNTRFIDVIRMPILNIPSCIGMNKYICQDKETVLLTASAIAKNISSEIEFQEEFMMQKGGEKFQPVVLSLRGKFLKADSSGNGHQMLCDVNHISSIRRVEEPRPHSVLLTWNSIFIVFSASNSSNANKLFERICSSRRQKSQESWPAHVILTDHSLLFFSAGFDKELLFRSPILNVMVNILQHNETTELLFESEINEAEESLSPESENPQWSLTFEEPFGAKTLYTLLTNISKNRHR